LQSNFKIQKTEEIKMKKNIFVAMMLLVSLFAFNLAWAEEINDEEIEEKQKLFDFELSSKFLSKYVDEAGINIHNKPVIQSEIFVRHTSSGIYLDIWYSTTAKNAGKDNNAANEVDYSVGWNKTIGPIAVDVGVTYIDLTSLYKGLDGDIIQPYIVFYKDINVADNHMITPFMRAEYGIPAKGNDPSLKGLRIHSGVKTLSKISNNKITINQKLTIVYDDGSYGMNRAWIGSYEIGPSYKVNDWMSIDLNGRVVSPLSHVNDGRKFEWIFGFGLTFYF
jgi:hypothetical protein